MPTKKRLHATRGALSGAASPISAKHQKVDANYVAAFPEVPASMVPPALDFEHESLPASQGKVDNGHKEVDENENLLRDFDIVMAEAQQYINSFDIKYSDFKKREVETKAEDGSIKGGLIDLDGIESTTRIEQDELVGNFKIDECIDMGSRDEPNNYHSQSELINMSIGHHDEPHVVRVREALKLFEDQYYKILQESDRKGDRKCASFAHLEAAKRVKLEGMWINSKKPFGHIPGIEIGREFRFRSELTIVGLHRQLASCIDYVVLDGKQFATSVVNSFSYENKNKGRDVIIYSGQGGISKAGKKVVDQKLEKGTLALVNSKEMGYPIRVTHKRKSLEPPNALGMNNKKNIIYTYDGLYIVKNYWEERGQHKKIVFKFELHRMDTQPRLEQTSGKLRTLRATTLRARTMREHKEVCVLDDISDGKENVKIRVMNGIDRDKPLPFIYTSKIIYPECLRPIEPIGCNCIHGCSDTKKCPCVKKNGGELPFNERGAIVRAKPLIHECGPLCKCPPTCMNRVSQRGPRHQLEIFKTKSRGWGLRSRNSISSGDFICEYLGELLQDKEAEERIGQDEYLFDISDDRFSIDAATYGNIGRFINHSCSPNLYAQEVLYDHDDKRRPHIMFFASEKIPSLTELSYDYNYKIGRVCDENGNIKTKSCHCGSHECVGRLY